MRSIKATYNQTIIDLALQGAGNVDLLLQTALLNGVSITDEIVAGNVYATPDAAIEHAKRATFFNQAAYLPCSIGEDEGITGLTRFYVVTPVISKGLLRVQEGQTIIDMALQGSGDVYRLFEVAKENGLSITDDIVAGDYIYTPAAALNKKKFSSFFNAAPNYPASGITGSVSNDEEEDLHGVGYDIIEDDQIVYP